MTSSDIVGTALVCAALAVLSPCAFAADDEPAGSTSAPVTMPADSTAAPTATLADSTLVAQQSEVAPTSFAAAAPPPDRFAFADNPLPWKPFAVGVGVGAGAYTADLEDVDRVFGSIENAYRLQGFRVPHADPVKLDVMRLYTVTARFEKVLDLTVQLGRSSGDQDQLRTNGLLLSRRIVSSSKGDLAVIAGGGAGTYRFSFTRTYGATTPVDSNGGYTSLDWVEVQGGGGYWTALGGFKIRPGHHVAIDLQAQYVGMEPATADTPQTGEVSVDLSGYCIGASIAFFL